MNDLTPLSLVDRLRGCAELWAEVNGGSLARIGKLVVNDNGYFKRLETQPRGTTTDSLERFAAFLGDTANWPEGDVPELVRDFVHRVGVSPAAGDAATGKAGRISHAG